MATETTSTSIVEIINSEQISMEISDYAMDAVVIAPTARVENLKATKVAAFPRWDKDTGADITEGTPLSNNELTLSETTVTSAQVGILREILDFAAEVSIVGPQGLYDMVVADGVALCTEMVEDDLAAQFADATGATVGTSGADLSIANFVEAIAKLRTAKARGKYVCVLDDQQAYDLQAAVAAATGGVFANSGTDQSVLNARSDGYVGSLFGVPIAMTNLTDTANGAADVVGAMYVDASNDPKRHAALGIALNYMPRVRARMEPSHPSTIISITMAYGVDMIYPALAVKLVTDA